MIAAAASISKARCEVDAAAATAAATQLASSGIDVGGNFNAFGTTLELVQLTLRNVVKEFDGMRQAPKRALRRFLAFIRRLLRLPPSSGPIAA